MLDFLSEANWLCLLLLLILAFLLGWFLSRWIHKNKFQEELDQCEREKAKLRSNQAKANSTFSAPAVEIPKPDPIDTSLEIKTPEIETPKIETPSIDVDNGDGPKLNFASFGAATEAEKDDLKLISGVGPFIEKKLNSIGIYTFDQISKFTKEDIDTVTALIQFFPGRIERDNWTDQAEKLKNK